MKFKLYRQYGALNSVDIFNAFAEGVTQSGFNISDSDDSIPVIWSVLWYGRMLGNRQIYYRAMQQKTPIIIIEVGNLIRNTTWRISVNHVNNQGLFGNDQQLDFDRSKKLGVHLQPLNNKRNSTVLIAAQHERSLQWEGKSSMSSWTETTIKEIRKYTDRPIIVRPHPRSPFSLSYLGVKITTPQKIPNTYDNFDINYNFHCVVNYNSGPGVQAAIQGAPIIVDRTSLASPVSDHLSNIENPQLPDRTEWFTHLCHTEWTREEIAQGTPLQRLLPVLESKKS